jgi:hypothetical protein
MMAQQGLDRSSVDSCFQEMRGVAVAKSVGSDPRQARIAAGPVAGILHRRRVQRLVGILCSYDMGLARGFTHYDDYYIPGLTGLMMVKMVETAVSALRRLTDHFVWRFYDGSGRKGASLINRHFLTWLSSRRQPERLFFAVLNYQDAHVPYVLPQGSPWLLGGEPHDKMEFDVLRTWEYIDNQTLSVHDLSLGRNAWWCTRQIERQTEAPVALGFRTNRWTTVNPVALKELRLLFN